MDALPPFDKTWLLDRTGWNTVLTCKLPYYESLSKAIISDNICKSKRPWMASQSQRGASRTCQDTFGTDGTVLDHQFWGRIRPLTDCL